MVKLDVKSLFLLEMICNTAEEEKAFIEQFKAEYSEFKKRYPYLEDYFIGRETGKGIPRKNILNGRKRRAGRKIYDIYENDKLIAEGLDCYEIGVMLGISTSNVYNYIKSGDNYRKKSKMEKYKFVEVKEQC